MTQELTTAAEHSTPMFQRQAPHASVNVGAVAIEQERAIAEVQGQLILAKRFPRDLNAAHAELMESASLVSMAEQAFYSVPNRGTGLSIRSAEEIARVFGNFEFGHRELARGDGKSEVEVYAWDKQTNNRSSRQITVMHVVDTKNGPKILRDQADIDARIANVASKQMRGRIMALMPKWLVADFENKCKQTLAGTSIEPISVRVRKMTQAFTKFGISDKHLSVYLGHPLDETTLDELVDLMGIYNALKEGARASDYFSAKEKDESEAIGEKLGETAAKAATTTPTPAPTARTKTKPVAQDAPASVQAEAATPAPTPSPEPTPTPTPTAKTKTPSPQPQAKDEAEQQEGPGTTFDPESREPDADGVVPAPAPAPAPTAADGDLPDLF